VDDWLLEHNLDGEVYTGVAATEENIRRLLGSFDGIRRFYCCLSSTQTEDSLACWGEVGQRVVEASLPDNPRYSVLSRTSMPSGRFINLRPGDGQVYSVDESHLISPQDCLSLFLTFLTSRRIPTPYVVVDTAYFCR
jgi:hypothetical protein